MTLIDSYTGEVIEQMTETEARQFVAFIHAAQDELPKRIVDAWRRRVWIVLGYSSWEDMCDGEGIRLRLPRDERQPVTFELRAAGMSTRAIGSALGVDQKTVVNDMQTEESSSVELPATVTSLDGRQRPAFHNAPKPTEPEPWSQEELNLRTALESGATVVVSLRGHHARFIDWATARDLYVRVDRLTPWGNPFETPADGDRATVIANYSTHYLPHKPSLLARIGELRGKALGCWCAPEPCHGDVLQARAES